MTIEHQIVLDSDGNPSAALIAWDDFEAIQERLADEGSPLSDEWKEELARRLETIRNGTAKCITGEEARARIHQHLADLKDQQKSA